jgi:hypothetical protein
MTPPFFLQPAKSYDARQAIATHQSVRLAMQDAHPIFFMLRQTFV